MYDTNATAIVHDVYLQAPDSMENNCLINSTEMYQDIKSKISITKNTDRIDNVVI